MLELELVSKDARGEIYVLKNKRGEEVANLDGFNAGAPRGGHYHSYPEIKTVVHGRLNYLRVDPRKIDSEIKTVVVKDDIIDIEPMIAHLFIALEDSLLFGTRGGRYETTNYQPYRKVVEDFLAKNK